MLMAIVKQPSERAWLDRNGLVIPTIRAEMASDRQRKLSRRAQALLAAAGEVCPERRWYVLRLAPGFDNAVDNILTEAHVEHWMAAKTFEAKRRGKRKFQSFCPVVMPALPGYIFVRVISNASIWAGLRTIEGVVDVLGGADNPAPVSEKEVLAMQAFIENDPKAIKVLHNLLSEGDRVHVGYGLFAGFDAIVLMLAKANSVRIEVDAFGRKVAIEVGLADVSKID